MSYKDRFGGSVRRPKRHTEDASTAGCAGGCDMQKPSYGTCDVSYLLPDQNCGYQRVPLFGRIPAATLVDGEIVPGEATITVTPDGSWFKAHSLLATAFLATSGQPANQVYFSDMTIKQFPQDCIPEGAERGVRVNSFGQASGCCDGPKICIAEFSNALNEHQLKITVKNYQAEEVLVDGHMTGWCIECTGRKPPGYDPERPSVPSVRPEG